MKERIMLKRFSVRTLLGILLFFGFAAQVSAQISIPTLLLTDEIAQVRINEDYGRLPLTFEANQGQADCQVKFLSRGSGYKLFLTPTEAVLSLRKAQAQSRSIKAEFKREAKLDKVQRAVIRMQFIDANQNPQIVGFSELPGKSNYFIGNEPTKWRVGIPNYDRIEYEEIYPGTNLIFYGNQQQLEYDFIINPGADPDAITFGFEGTDNLEIDATGNIVLTTMGGKIVQHAPDAYQRIRGVKHKISAHYVHKGKNKIGFQVAAYDANRPLIIDPVLSYSTYIGGSSHDITSDIAVDGTGNVYVTGITTSTNFPTANPIQGFAGHQDIFVIKLNSTGTILVYSTYLGGSSSESGPDIAIDLTGNAFITGQTYSSNFPTTAGAFQTALAGVNDAFVTKLNASGSALIYSTYLGGSGASLSGTDRGQDIAVDTSGNAYVTGQTGSPSFPTTDAAFQTTYGGNGDAFVTKLNTSGAALVYSNFLGGSDSEEGFAIAVDDSGNAYVSGATFSTDFPIATAFQAVHGGSQDAFVTKLNASGSALIYSTHLGGDSADRSYDIAIDSVGSAYVTGSTCSVNFPTANAFQSNCIANGICNDNAFVTKLNSAGDDLVYSTYIGGSGLTSAQSIAVDSAGNVCVTGFTDSTDFPVVLALQSERSGYTDAFVTMVNADGSALLYSTYLGGSGSDSGWGIAVYTKGTVYVTGATDSTDFPTVNPLQPVYAGGLRDSFIAKITFSFPRTINKAMPWVPLLLLDE